MNQQHRREILDMLSTGKITSDEAERLLAALDRERPAPDDSQSQKRPKYLRVAVENEEDTKVNIRVPMQLLRAGVRLASLIPPQARKRVDEAMRERGVTLDLAQVKPENLEELIDQLGDMTVDVDNEDVRVRVFCE
jgi:polyhydroxyalkanoate synthesis regulator phasin